MDSNIASKRRDEIEQKKERLRQLRKQREQRERIRHSIGHSSERPASPVNSGLYNSRQELDSLIISLVGESKPASVDAASPGSQGRPMSVSNSGIDPISLGSALNRVRITVSTQTSDLPGGDDLKVIGVSKPIVEQAESEQRRQQPVERITYSKGVQTVETPFHGAGSDSDDDGSMSPVSRKKHQRKHREKEEQLRETIRAEIEAELREIYDKESGTAAQEGGSKSTFLTRDFSEAEVNAITGSDEFMDFIDQSTKVIERALDQEYDILADYALSGNLDASDDEDGAGAPKGRRVKEVGHFWDPRWSSKRMLSDLSFSPKFPELLVASYTKNPSAPQDPDGIVQVWNLHMHERPEYVFYAQSDILTVKFSPFHPSLILGGCYSGQVLVWDTRVRGHAPVQKTQLTGVGHAHPVYSLDVVGTQNANNIISASTDGVVCSWTVNMLSQPQEYLELTNPRGVKTDEFAPTCVAFPSSDPTYFLAGSEEGAIVPCHRYDRAGAKAGIDPRESYRGHTAPITSLSFHPSHGPVDLGDFLLSSSLDWSVKMWRARPPASVATSTAGLSQARGASGTGSTNHGSGAPGSSSGHVTQPLLEFFRDDLVYDVKWSPTRPAVFALVDGAGNLEVWDLNFDTEVPAVKVKPGEVRRNRGRANKSVAAQASQANPAGNGASSDLPSQPATAPAPLLPPGVSSSLNRIAWEPSEGRRVAVGGLDGVVSVFEVGGLLGGTEMQSADEWAGMKRLVSRLENL